MRIKREVITKTPAKIIISGEHAVIYNKQAITCSIDLYVKVVIKRYFSKKKTIIIYDNKKKVLIDVDDFFLKKNKGNIYEIIKFFFQETKISPIGFKIEIKNEIPQNQGFGSSASLIVGVLFGLNEFFQTNIDTDKLIKMATEVENMFHGRSSGIDIKTVFIGGVNYFNEDTIIKLPVFTKYITLINTGKPNYSTKDVVEFIKNKDIKNDILLENFKKNTENIAQLINKHKDFANEVRLNQENLDKIGVISSYVSNFIKSLFSVGVYGKICGAGTIKEKESQNNGVIGVFQNLTKKQKSFVKKQCKKYNFNFKTAKITTNGLLVWCK